MRSRNIVGFGLALSLLMAGASQAGVTFSTGNNQYTNVNIQSDTNAFVIVGNIGTHATDPPVNFTGYDNTNTQIELHGQHGVAFVEAYSPSDHLYSIVFTMGDGVNPTSYLASAMDWKLDAVNGQSDGTVTFTAFDANGGVIPLSSGTNSFAFSVAGQNPFQLNTDGGSLVYKVVMTSTIEIADIKQVSVNPQAVPEPGTLAAAGVGVLFAAARVLRRRKA